MDFIYVANVVPIQGSSFTTKTINVNGKSSQKRHEACGSKLLRFYKINLYMQRTSNVSRTRSKFKKKIYIIYVHITDKASVT